MKPEEVQPEKVQQERHQEVQPQVTPEPNHVQPKRSTADARDAIRYLSRVSRHSSDIVLRTAAHSLQAYLQ